MSYVTPQYAPPSGQPSRPTTVTIASLSLYAMALLSLVSVALGVISFSSIDSETITDIYMQAGADKAVAETAGGIVLAVMYATAGLSVVFAIVYILLGVFVGKGKNWARITAWVFGGLAICCNALGAAGGAAGSSFGGTNSGGLDADLVQEKLSSQIPAWINSANTGLAVIALLLALSVVTTLALPASNAFFRRPEPEWVPPAV